MLLDEVTRDYVPSVKLSPLAKACCLLPWKPYSLMLDDPVWNSVEQFVCPPITVCVCVLSVCVCICVCRDIPGGGFQRNHFGFYAILKTLRSMRDPPLNETHCKPLSCCSHKKAISIIF